MIAETRNAFTLWVAISIALASLATWQMHDIDFFSENFLFYLVPLVVSSVMGVAYASKRGSPTFQGGAIGMGIGVVIIVAIIGLLALMLSEWGV